MNLQKVASSTVTKRNAWSLWMGRSYAYGGGKRRLFNKANHHDRRPLCESPFFTSTTMLCYAAAATAAAATVTAVSTFATPHSSKNNSNRTSTMLLCYAAAAAATVTAVSAFTAPSSSKNSSNNIQQHGSSLFSKIQNNIDNTTTSCSPISSSAVLDYDGSGDNEIESNELDPSQEFNNGNIHPFSYYYERMKEPPRSMIESHAVFGPLKKKGGIERYNVYRVVKTKESNIGTTISKSSDKEEVAIADIKFGNNLNGHDGIVHGGIISLMFDDAFGWGYEAMGASIGKSMSNDDFPIVVTANLSVNFRSPLPAESDVVIRVYHDKTEERKVYVSARMENHDGTILYSEASALFIKLKSKNIL